MLDQLAAPSLADPVGNRVWEIGIVVVAVGLLVVGTTQSVRARALSPLFLMTVASATSWWVETYGDWGVYVLYSDKFARFPWGDTPYTSPLKHWWFIAGYAVFYPTTYGLMLKTVAVARRYRPNVNPYVAAVVLSLPVFYVFDLLFEGTATSLGWWDYTHTFGPAIRIGNGQFPLLWPILEQVPFLAVASIALIWRDDRGRDVFHRVAAVAPAGWRRETATLATWIVAANVSLFLLVDGVLVLFRVLFGPSSTLVP